MVTENAPKALIDRWGKGSPHPQQNGPWMSREWLSVSLIRLGAEAIKVGMCEMHVSFAA